MKRGPQNKHIVAMIASAAVAATGAYFLVPGFADALKGGMDRGGASATPPPNAGQQHSMDFERDLKQFLSITDMAQSGLDITGDSTFEAWVKLESIGEFNTNHHIVDKGSVKQTNVTYSYYWRSNDPNKRATDDINLFLSQDGGTNASPFSSEYKARTGEWTHLAATFSAATSDVKIYVNGLPRAVTGPHFIHSLHTNNQPFIVGSRAGTFDFLDGKIDEVRVWNVARTPEEIAANYTAELSGAEAGLVGYWKFNAELVDGKIKDSSSKNNHLKLNNKPQFSTDSPIN